MEATEQCLPVVLFIMLYKVVLTFECVDEILKYDHSNESSTAVNTIFFIQNLEFLYSFESERVKHISQL